MNAAVASPFERIPARGAPLPRVPVVSCCCVSFEDPIPDPFCHHCTRGRPGEIVVRCCWCHEPGALTDIESRDIFCLTCARAWSAFVDLAAPLVPVEQCDACGAEPAVAQVEGVRVGERCIEDHGLAHAVRR